jgi:hypothetical protein
MIDQSPYVVRPPLELARRSSYRGLLKDSSFDHAIARATADEENVKQRLAIATDAIGKVP